MVVRYSTSLLLFMVLWRAFFYFVKLNVSPTCTPAAKVHFEELCRFLWTFNRELTTIYFREENWYRDLQIQQFSSFHLSTVPEKLVNGEYSAVKSRTLFRGVFLFSALFVCLFAIDIDIDSSLYLSARLLSFVCVCVCVCVCFCMYEHV